MTSPRYIIPSYLRGQSGFIYGCDRKTRRIQCAIAVVIGFGLLVAVYTLVSVYFFGG